MDVSVRQQLAGLVEELTHSGAPSLDEKLLKKLKRICKSSDDNINTTYNLIMADMAKKHAEIRLSAFQLAAELFPRSHLFRLLLTSSFQRLAQLVTGTDPKHPLPPPRAAASRLKETSLLAIRQWHERFGAGYPKLKVGYNFLKFSKKVDFDRLVAQSESSRRQSEARVARRAAFVQQRLREVCEEMKDQRNDIDSCLTQLESCFNLLLPRFDEMEVYHPTTSSSTSSAALLQDSQGAILRNSILSTSSFASMDSMEEEEGGEGEVEEEGEEEEVEEKRRGGEVVDSKEEEKKTFKHSAGEKHENEKETKEIHSKMNDKNDSNAPNVTADLHLGNTGNGISDSGHPPLIPPQHISTPISLLHSVYGFRTSGGRKGVGVRREWKGKGREKEKLVADEEEEEEGDYGGREGVRVRNEGNWRGKEEEGSGGDGFNDDSGGDEHRRQESDESSSDDESEVEWVEVEGGGGGPSLASESSQVPLQEHGIVGHGVSIPIQLSTQINVKETEDNLSILAALEENMHILQDKYLPAVNTWMQWLIKAGEEEEDLKEAIDVKNRIMNALEKRQKLNIEFKHPKKKSVPVATKEKKSLPSQTTPTLVSQAPPTLPSVAHSYSASSSHPTRPNQGSGIHSMSQELEQDPTTIHAQLRAIKSRLPQKTPTSTSSSSSALPPPPPPSSSSSSSRSHAPVVPFDMDLFHWDSTSETTPLIHKTHMSSIHQYWGTEREVELSEDEKALLKCRSILFPGKFEPVKWSCRAPLPSGKLCPRKDRVKCPFHGKIIPRDEQGNPVIETSTSTTVGTVVGTAIVGTSTSTHSSGASEADMVAIEEAVFAAKGIELPKKKKKGRAKKYPGLTDLKAHNNTPRKRLERKVLSKKALRRVAGIMEGVSVKQYRDKFGDNFNYALKN